MKKSFTTLAVVFMTLCTSPAALAEAPVPSSNEGAKIAVFSMPKLYYSPRSGSAPQVVTNMGSRVVEQGVNVVFEVVFSGSMPLEMTALFNGRPVDRSARLTAEKSAKPKYESLQDEGCYIFVIKQVVPEDSGIYEIRAINSFGQCSARGRVLVLQ